MKNDKKETIRREKVSVSEGWLLLHDHDEVVVVYLDNVTYVKIYCRSQYFDTFSLLFEVVVGL